MGVEVSSVAFFTSLAYDKHVLRFELFRPKRWQRRRCSVYTTVCTTFTIVLGGTSTEGSVHLRDQHQLFRRVWSSVIRPEPRGLQQPSRSHLCDGSFSGAGRTTGASQMSNTHLLGRSFPARDMEPQSDECLFEHGLPEWKWRSLQSPSSHLWSMMSTCFVSNSSVHSELFRSTLYEWHAARHSFFLPSLMAHAKVLKIFPRPRGVPRV